MLYYIQRYIDHGSTGFFLNRKAFLFVRLRLYRKSPINNVASFEGPKSCFDLEYSMIQLGDKSGVNKQFKDKCLICSH